MDTIVLKRKGLQLRVQPKPTVLKRKIRKLDEKISLIQIYKYTQILIY